MLSRAAVLAQVTRVFARTVHTDVHASSVNPAEIAHFSRLSAQWWDEQGEFALLHRINPVRMRFILDMLRDEGSLAGLNVLDVGCGGGLLSESLARLGANTLGIDASPANIQIATLHAAADPGSRPLYRATSAEALLADFPGHFDILCAMEVLEHVQNPATFLRTCASLVKPGGHIFLSTIARTPLAYTLTILLAEHIFRLVSPGTHTYANFISPAELLAFFRDDFHWRAGTAVQGLIYRPWDARWVLAPHGMPGSTECNYIFWARKPHV